MIALVDVDGVLADFVGHVLVRMKEECGCTLKFEDIGEKHMYTQFSEEERTIADRLISAPDFAYELPAIVTGMLGLTVLRKIGYHVVFVTAPWTKSPTWCYDRRRWLVDWFGAGERDVIFSNRKEIIAGDLFIDDYPRHVEAWKESNPNDMGFLLSQPWNGEHAGWSWEEIIRHVEWNNGASFPN